MIEENFRIYGELRATFPIELAETAVINFSPKHGIVLDPFMGCGTTALASIKNDRNFIGIELSKEYCEITKKRIQNKDF